MTKWHIEIFNHRYISNNSNMTIQMWQFKCDNLNMTFQMWQFKYDNWNMIWLWWLTLRSMTVDSDVTFVPSSFAWTVMKYDCWELPAIRRVPDTTWPGFAAIGCLRRKRIWYLMECMLKYRLKEVENNKMRISLIICISVVQTKR